VLHASNRLRSSEDFSRTTKTGLRITTPSLVVYLAPAQLMDSESPINQNTQFGLIVNKSIGGSVTRHRIARHLRHALRDRISLFPSQSQVVVRVIKETPNYINDLDVAISRLQKKVHI